MSVNPYIEGRKKEIELNQRKKLVENDIEFIKRDLESKTNMLLESRKNHVKSYEEQIAEIKASCTHMNEEGNPATSLTHKDILIPTDGGYHAQHFCELCGARFIGKFIPVEKPKEVGTAYLTFFDELRLEDEIGLIDNIEFNPYFNSSQFLETTATYFSSIFGGDLGKGKKKQ